MNQAFRLAVVVMWLFIYSPLGLEAYELNGMSMGSRGHLNGN